MPQDQHFLPQAYLRQWCDEQGTLIRYRKLRSPAKLLKDRKSPKGVAFEVDLYTLPVGGSANGLTANEVEGLLGKKVDESVGDIARRAATSPGEVADDAFAREIIWLMQAFIARHPKKLREVEAGVAELLAEESERIDFFVERALMESSRQELLGFKSLNMPRVAARAGLIATVEGLLPHGTIWLEGDVHVLQAKHFGAELAALGATEFVTFDGPVVSWDANASKIATSFALSPESLVVITERGTSLSRVESAGLIRNHLLNPIPFREMLICRQAPTGLLLAQAELLVPGAS